MPGVYKRKKNQTMSEFNCTYSRALTIYVPPFSPRPVEQYPIIGNTSNNSPQQHYYSPDFMSYASAVGNKYKQTTNAQNQNASREHRQVPTKRKQRSSSEQIAYYDDNSSLSSEPCSIAMNQRSAPFGVRMDTETETARAVDSRTNHCETRTISSMTTTHKNNFNCKLNDSCSNKNPNTNECAHEVNSEVRGSNKSFESLMNKIKEIIFFQKIHFFTEN